MGKIYCVMGKSASGKDTIYREILRRCPKLGTYVMYTTRPMREGEMPGVSYNFIDEEALRTWVEQGKLIESRTYQTIYGPWTYATIDDGQIVLAEKDYLIPGTLESYEKLKSYYGEDVMVPIYIEVEDGERLLRAIHREQLEAKPKYSELCRRFLADEKDFSEENLMCAGIHERFENVDLETCVTKILERFVL